MYARKLLPSLTIYAAEGGATIRTVLCGVFIKSLIKTYALFTLLLDSRDDKMSIQEMESMTFFPFFQTGWISVLFPCLKANKKDVKNLSYRDSRDFPSEWRMEEGVLKINEVCLTYFVKGVLFWGIAFWQAKIVHTVICRISEALTQKGWIGSCHAESGLNLPQAS